MTVAKLSDDAHLSGGILANANWFGTVFEFPPAPFPVNHRYETVEGGKNRFGRTVFHPHAKPRRVLSFIRAGGWFAHPFAPRAVAALFSV